MRTRSRRMSRLAFYSPLRLEPLEPRTLFSATPPTPAQLVGQANNAFAFDLFHQLDRSGNVFFSPYSIATALEMTLQGASAQTAAEMIKALHLPAADLAQAGIQALCQLLQPGAQNDVTLSTANRLWVNDNFPLFQSFLDQSQQVFGAQPESVDFSDPVGAANTINAWVSDQTHGKITDLVPADAIDRWTRLILTNAIYFKGQWRDQFSVGWTQAKPFNESPTQTITVQMMEQTDHFGYFERTGPGGFQAVSLPYEGGDLDMLIVLPRAQSLDSFDFTSAIYSDISQNLKWDNVDLSLPRFKLDNSYSLAEPLQALGIKAAFFPGAFNGISPSSSLSISAVLHKSFIQVDENGSEAAAATAVVLRAQILAITSNPDPPPPPKVFNANHPFLFAIREHSTGAILFMGQVTEPGDVPAPVQTTPPGWIGPLPPRSIDLPAPPIWIYLPPVPPHDPIVILPVQPAQPPADDPQPIFRWLANTIAKQTMSPTSQPVASPAQRVMAARRSLQDSPLHVAL